MTTKPPVTMVDTTQVSERSKVDDVQPVKLDGSRPQYVSRRRELRCFILSGDVDIEDWISVIKEHMSCTGCINLEFVINQVQGIAKRELRARQICHSYRSYMML